jgi:hypothetical protein
MDKLVSAKFRNLEKNTLVEMYRTANSTYLVTDSRRAAQLLDETIERVVLQYLQQPQQYSLVETLHRLREEEEGNPKYQLVKETEQKQITSKVMNNYIDKHAPNYPAAIEVLS